MAPIIVTRPRDEDDERYLESLRQNLSYEEQVELEIQRRRRRAENDEMQPDLLPIVNEEEEFSEGEKNTVTATKRVYIDSIKDAYLGPLQLLGRHADLSHYEFEPQIEKRTIEVILIYLIHALFRSNRIRLTRSV